MSYKRARKISHNNGMEYVRIHDDKKQIVMNQVITLYGRWGKSKKKKKSKKHQLTTYPPTSRSVTYITKNFSK